MHAASREFLDGGEGLPQYYGEDRLVLMPRDPYWLFAYWDFNVFTRDQVQSEARQTWDKLNLALRIYRLNTTEKEQESYFDIAITPSADNWYIKVGVPDKKYRAELGCFLPDGNFRVLLQSNLVTTPRDRLSDVIDEKWRLPDWQARRLYWRIAWGNLSSLEMLRRGINLKALR